MDYGPRAFDVGSKVSQGTMELLNMTLKGGLLAEGSAKTIQMRAITIVANEEMLLTPMLLKVMLPPE